MLFYNSFRALDEIIEMIESTKQAIEDFLGSIGSVLEGLHETLAIVGDVVAEISGFFSTIGDLIYSDIFTDMDFDNFFEFFAGKKSGIFINLRFFSYRRKLGTGND